MGSQLSTNATNTTNTINSNIVHPVTTYSLKQKLDLATTSTSSILERTSDTVYLDDIKNINQLKGKVPDDLFNVVTSNEFKELRPELFNRVLFHDRMCKISLEINTHPDKLSNHDICINTEFLNKS